MNKAKEVAMGGLMTALSIVIMCFGTLLPFMTYVSPVFCLMIGGFLLKIFSKKGFVSWYMAVSILSLIMCPDKEAASVFVAFGSYPLVRMYLEILPLKWIFKLLYFNVLTLLLYWILLRLIGIQELVNEFAGIGRMMTIGMLLAGNLIFVLIDKMLFRFGRFPKIKLKRGD